MTSGGKPRKALVGVYGWSAITLLWIVLLVRTQLGLDDRILYGVMILLSLALAAGNFVMLRRATRKGADNPGSDREG